MGIYLFPIPIWHVTIVEFWPSLTKVLQSWASLERKYWENDRLVVWSWGKAKVMFDGLIGRSWRPERLMLTTGISTRQSFVHEAFFSHSSPLSKLLAKEGRRGERESEVGSAPVGSFQNLLQNNSIITNRQALFSWPQKHTWRQKCGGSEERHMVG